MVDGRLYQMRPQGALQRPQRRRYSQTRSPLKSLRGSSTSIRRVPKNRSAFAPPLNAIKATVPTHKLFDAALERSLRHEPDFARKVTHIGIGRGYVSLLHREQLLLGLPAKAIFQNLDQTQHALGAMISDII